MNEQSAKPRGLPTNLVVAATLFFLAGGAAGVAGESSTASERRDAPDLAHHLIAKAGASQGLCSLLGCPEGTPAFDGYSYSASFERHSPAG